MHEALNEIPERILKHAVGALTQANHHAVYYDFGNEHWGFMSVVNSAHAGELFLKAIIAQSHPLLIFKDFFNLSEADDEMNFEDLVRKGRTHEFGKLPKVFWAVTGEKIPHPDVYKNMQETRNAIQHFCATEDDRNFRKLSLNFIYSVIDPLINKHFGLHAIEFHEDHSIGYDYVVDCLFKHEIKFCVPPNFNVTEIDLHSSLENSSSEYRDWFFGCIQCQK